VVWIGLDEPSGGLAELQRELELRIAKLGFSREDRPFHPHLTLARARREASPSDLRRVAEALDRTQLGELGPLEIRQLSLMRSQLSPAGASYSCLHRAPLTGSG
jgi:2'-5' RNA ligase